MIDKREWRKALPAIGVRGTTQMFDRLFDVVDEERSGSLEMGALRRTLRKSVFTLLEAKAARDASRDVGKGGKEANAAKESKESKEGKEGKEGKVGKEGKEGKESKEGKEGKEGKEAAGPQSLDGAPAAPAARLEVAGAPLWPDDPAAAVAAAGGGPGGFWDLVLSPPQQKLELTETNAYSWPGATEAEERDLYRATWGLLHARTGLGGLTEALCAALRSHGDDPRFPLYLGGNVPLNYYLVQAFGAPAPIPSNDVDVKVDIGDHLRSLLRARGGSGDGAETMMPPSHSDHGDLTTPDAVARTDAQRALFAACKRETIARFVAHAAALMAAMEAATAALLPEVERALAPRGFGLGAAGVHVHHKTHTAARAGKPPFHIVPVSGGVFQLMVELIHTASGHSFLWNVVDLEADWKLAGPAGAPGWSKWPSWRGHSWPPRAHSSASEGLGLPSALVRRGPAPQTSPLREAVAFPPEAAQVDDFAAFDHPGAPAPCEVVPADSSLAVRGLRLLAPAALRADLEHSFQPSKERRRAYKRAYWDWAVARHAERQRQQRGAAGSGKGQGPQH